jgi:superfamily II DNA helicase RecQ
MSFSFFQISCRECPETEARLNQFINANRVLSVDRRWVDLGENSFWAICVDYLENTSSGSSKKKSERIDYREVLQPEEFAVFSALRDLRKTLAAEAGVPVYTVFTNEQLAKMVTDQVKTLADLKKIPGLGTAKIDKYGAKFIEQLCLETVNPER